MSAGSQAQRAEDYGNQIQAKLSLEPSSGGAETLGAFALDLWRGINPRQVGNRDLTADTELTRQAFEVWQRPAPQAQVAAFRDETRQMSRFVVRQQDMPFITDSVLLVFTERDLPLEYLHNVVIATERTAPTSLVVVETTALETEEQQALEAELTAVLQEISDCVSDYSAMKEKLANVRERLLQGGGEDAAEAAAFLEWLRNDHFTFLGYRAFDFSDGHIEQQADSALGTLRNRRPASRRPLQDMRPEARDFLLEPTPLSFSKAGTKARVHRPAYPDYVGVKRFNEAGEVIGEDGFLGLYTSPVYTEQPSRIPVIRQRVQRVLEQSGYAPRSFDHKALQQVLATFPRDELFQATEEELFSTATAIAHIHERRETKVFLNRSRYGMFYNCLVYLPRDALHTRVRTSISELLARRLGALDVEFDPFFSESVLVRLQYIVRVDPQASHAVDAAALEQEILALAQDWRGELKRVIRSAGFNPKQLTAALAFEEAFPTAYQERFDVRTALSDIGHALSLDEEQHLILRFHRPPGNDPRQINLKVLKLGDALPLSQLVPVLEHLGFEVLSEQPYRLRTEAACFNIQDFTLRREAELELEAIGPIFEDAFRNIWQGAAESDALNGLIVAEQLAWREVALLRSYARYMKQAGFGIEQSFIAATLLKHPQAARMLVDCFVERLDPSAVPGTAAADFTHFLDSVSLINEDRVLRHLFQLIQATVRSNFFRDDLVDAHTMAHKLACQEIPGLPEPRPLFEIFVYAPDLEGVHLRSSRVARGGLRWSDRPEDFRTEVLGLVKAQIVKNAVIVPSGAKGGFVLKATPDGLSRDAWLELGQSAYRQFIRSLLSVTDNLVDGKLVPPPKVARLDGDDPYLVVAADKGTATFSDIANELAVKANFWLGDAFASGGSVGYDHKKMGITARGAWVSVQRHFRTLGVDPQVEPIRTVAIGDMSGDVFGNGMLQSRSIALLAAFNHLHIFIDPNPDLEAAYGERERLFALPRSGWMDYDQSLISPGGGVFERTQKTIPISAEMRSAFGLEADHLAPDELLRALLAAPVDLLWNGGIGTYVKANGEANEQVGDRANDSLRRNGSSLRARVVGEGGNLGLTHQGRIEFADTGGLVNADFIDNAGGVDCSDHEVNLKILLADALQAGRLAAADRDQLLLAHEDQVAELVLANNFLQARCLSLAAAHSRTRVDEYNRLALRLEQEMDFRRSEANFPEEDLLLERARTHHGLLLPELSTLLGYGKILLKQQLADARLHEDPILGRTVADAFPAALAERFGDELKQHRLRAEIVLTQLANEVVGVAGITFVNRLVEFVGCSPEDVVRAYVVVSQLFELPARMAWFDCLDCAPEQREAGQLALMRFCRRATRWLIRRQRSTLLPEVLLSRYETSIGQLLQEPERLFLTEAEKHAVANRRQTLAEQRPELPAATLGFELFGALAVAEAAADSDAAVQRAGPIYQQVGEKLGIDRLTAHLTDLVPGSHWRAMERDALLDDLCDEQLNIVRTILATDTTIDSWLESQRDFVQRWTQILQDAPLKQDSEFAALAMTVRKLMDLSSFN